MAIDYTGARSALKDMLEAADYSSIMTAQNRINKVKAFEEAMVNEVILSNMPLLNVRLVDSQTQLRSMPNGYYEYIMFEVDIYAVDFTSLKEASSLRDAILRIARNTVQANAQFHVDLQTSRLGPKTEFGAGAHEGGGHIAMATFQVVAEADIEAT